MNPLATITAFAERTVEEIAKKGGLKIDMETENGNIDAASRPRVSNLRDNHPKEANKMKNSTCSIGWQFTEILDGHISMQSESVRFITAETTGKGSSCAIRAYLTIEICKKATGKWYDDTLSVVFLHFKVPMSHGTLENVPALCLVMHFQNVQ